MIMMIAKSIPKILTDMLRKKCLNTTDEMLCIIQFSRRKLPLRIKRYTVKDFFP